jgi:hypothetical protein
MMTVGVLDYLLERKEKVLLVECDTSNPDVWMAYKGQLEAKLIDLDQADGWIHLVNTCKTHRDRVVVINTAARNNLAVRQYGQTLDSSLDELGSKLVALWMINRRRDSLELLADFMESIPKADVHVVRNGYFGEERKFELYHASKVRNSVEGRGGKSVTLPDLADRVADERVSSGRGAPPARSASRKGTLLNRPVTLACGPIWHIETFDDFWSHYVHAHRHPINRALHYAGTTAAVATILGAAVTINPGWLLLAPVVSYGPAWAGHSSSKRTSQRRGSTRSGRSGATS